VNKTVTFNFSFLFQCMQVAFVHEILHQSLEHLCNMYCDTHMHCDTTFAEAKSRTSHNPVFQEIGSVF